MSLSSERPGRRRALRFFGLLAAVAVLGIGPTGWARAAGDPVAFLQNLGDRAIAMLSDPGLVKAEREDNFRQLMREGFDLNAVSRFILGRYWQSANQEQRSEFIDVFQRVMAARFAPYFSGTSEDTFKLVGPARGSSADAPVVRSKIKLSGGQLAEVDWRLKPDGDSFRIVDVVTEGVSMGITLRSEYGSVLKRSGGDLEPLVKLLRDKVGSSSS